MGLCVDDGKLLLRAFNLRLEDELLQVEYDAIVEDFPGLARFVSDPSNHYWLNQYEIVLEVSAQGVWLIGYHDRQTPMKRQTDEFTLRRLARATGLPREGTPAPTPTPLIVA